MTIEFYERLGFEVLDDRRDAAWPDDQGAFFGLTPKAPLFAAGR